MSNADSATNLQPIVNNKNRSEPQTSRWQDSCTVTHVIKNGDSNDQRLIE